MESNEFTAFVRRIRERQSTEWQKTAVNISRGSLSVTIKRKLKQIGSSIDQCLFLLEFFRGNQRFQGEKRSTYVTVERDVNGNIIGYKGYCYEIIHALQKLYNFT